MNRSFKFHIHVFSRLRIQTKEIKGNNLQITATICQVSQPWAFFLQEVMGPYFVLTHCGLVLYDCFVPKLSSIHILSSFYILICPSVLFPSAALRTVIIFRASWSLSETIPFQTALHSPATEFLLFLQRSHDKGPGATLMGLDPSPTCCGWDLSSAGSSGPRTPHFHFVSERLRSLEMMFGVNPFCGRLSI